MRASWLSLLVIAVLLLMPGTASAAPPEIDILDAYLSEHDHVPGTHHCARHDGTFGMGGGPPMGTPAGGTNAIMEEHKAWHVRYGPGFDPDPGDEDRYGDIFVLWHREFVGTYEAWREAEGHPPLPAWDPGTPLPPNLAYSFPGRGCLPGGQDDPGLPLPTWATLEGGSDQDPVFGNTAMCQYEGLNQFGKALAAGYHPLVHQAMGEGVGPVSAQDPREPWFWSFHRFLDDVTLDFEATCLAGDANLAPAQTDREETRDAPMLPSMVTVPALLFALGLILRRRRGS